METSSGVDCVLEMGCAMEKSPLLNVARCLIALVLVVGASPMYADTLRAKDDTDVNLNQPGQVNGATANVFVRDIGAGGIRHAFVRFDTDPVPTGAIVSQATLRLWISSVAACNRPRRWSTSTDVSKTSLTGRAAGRAQDKRCRPHSRQLTRPTTVRSMCPR